MAAFFTFSQRNSYNPNLSSANKQDAAIDPWNLGVSTSTSTADTIGQQSSSDDTLLSTRTPPTPEGLRPRKSIQRIRKDILGSNHYRQEAKFSHNLPSTGDANSHPAKTLQGIHRDPSTLPIRRSIPSFGRQTGIGILPSSFQRFDGSPIRSSSSFYEQSVEGSNYPNDEDFDINSSMEDSIFSRQSRHSYRSRQIAESPDLKRGGNPKTAVGALLVAMAETSAEPKKETALDENRYKEGVHNERYHNRILPPRMWMDDHPIDDGYPMHDNVIDEDDTICDDVNQAADINDSYNDDNQSSLHASPSSFRRNILPTSWIDRKQHFLKDTSFTRRILNDDPSSSRLEERSIIGHSPYDFNPITTEGIHGDLKRESYNAPPLLSVVKDNARLDLSAISISQHQKGVESVNTSLADTIEDEEEEYREIPMYYQALADDVPDHNVISEDAFIAAKTQNQRRDKEDLLRSTFERLQDCLYLLKDLSSPSSKDNSLFLGLGRTKAGTECYKNLQALLSELQEGASYGTQRQALLFCISILQNSASLSSPHWVPLPGFRSSLGLKEEPQSPQTIRGGDTSLFSLPSDSVNEGTPHTSNVSMATTITTLVSPERYGSSIYKHQQQRSHLAPSDQNEGDFNLQDIRKTIHSLAQLLYRLEETCRDLKSKKREKSKFLESIQNVYYGFLDISAVDLREIVNSFEMQYSQPNFLTRTVSDDQHVAASRSLPPFRSSYQKERTVTENHATRTNDTLRVNIMECDTKDIDNDNVNQSIECDLWSPTTNDMMSLVSPESEEENKAIGKDGYFELEEDDFVDDLRRTVGSFDDTDVDDEREEPPSFDEDEGDHATSFPATFARRFVAQRSRKSRFWKKRFSALKNRGRQVTAE